MATMLNAQRVALKGRAFQPCAPMVAVRGRRALAVRASGDDAFANYKPTIAALFPGQGAQSVGMAKDLVATVPKAKEMFDKASEILGYDLLKVGAGRGGRTGQGRSGRLAVRNRMEAGEGRGGGRGGGVRRGGANVPVEREGLGTGG